MIASQIHGRFKIFAGALEPGHRIDSLAHKVAEFGRTVAAKSIGVEYLESQHKLIVTLGYRDDEAPYPIALHCVSLGRAEKLDGADFAALEQRMAEEGARLKRVICHELFITEDHEFLMVLMTHTGS
jgi:hypothetical protein